MRRNQTRDTEKPRLDRWATLNDFTDKFLAGLVKEASPEAAVVWFTLFRMASGRDGSVRGASGRRLATTTGLCRNTIRKALKQLIASQAIQVQKREQTGSVIYVLNHTHK